MANKIVTHYGKIQLGVCLSFINSEIVCLVLDIGFETVQKRLTISLTRQITNISSTEDTD